MIKNLKISIKEFLYCMKQVPVSLISYNRFQGKNEKEIAIQPDNVSYFTLSSNTIMIIETAGKMFFFRECRRHVDKRTYFKNALDEFYDVASKSRELYSFTQKVDIRTDFEDEYLREFMDYVVTCELQADFFCKIAKTDAVLKAVGFSIWRGKEGYWLDKETLEKLGLSDFPEKYRDILPLFLLYVRGLAYSYRMNMYNCKNEIEVFHASKMIASWKIAEQMHCEDLLTSAELVVLNINNKKKTGVLSSAAPGLRAQDLKRKLTPSIQRALSSLSVLDIICNQTDHGINNYNVVLEQGMPVSVCAFDNDNPYTFWPRTGIAGKKVPYLDKKIACTINNMNMLQLEKELSHYINSIQLAALKSRLKKVQKVIHTMDRNHILCENQWCEKTIVDELSGKYGRTYSCIFHDK